MKAHTTLGRKRRTRPIIADDPHDESEDRKGGLKDKLETLLWVWSELLLSAAAITIGVLAYRFNDVLGDQTGQFSRSGSVIVLLGVVNEYRLGTLRDRQLSYREPDSLRSLSFEIRRLFTPSIFLGQRIARGIAHVQIIMGTLIWGYGDLVIRGLGELCSTS